jgi:hypothetical protein
MSLTVGGGVSQFVHDAIANNASAAGSWDARLLFGTRFPIGFEAAYLGTAASANDPFNSTTISTTQVFGDARVNLTTWRIQPFITGGVGWANLHRWGNSINSPVASVNFNGNTNSVMVPVGGGLAGYIGRHTVLDARFDYHFITSKDFTPGNMRADMWMAMARAGYAF